MYDVWHSYNFPEYIGKSTWKIDNQTAQDTTKRNIRSVFFLKKTVSSRSFRLARHNSEAEMIVIDATLSSSLTFRYGDRTVVAGFRKEEGSPLGFSNFATHSCSNGTEK